MTRPRMPLQALVLMAAVACVPAGAAGDHVAAQLRLINLVQRTQRITVRLCPALRGACRSLSLPQDTAGPLLKLAPGRYDFALIDDGRVLRRFQYGLAANGTYGLALYGVSMPPARIGVRQKARSMLGGLDEPRINGNGLAQRMTMMRPGDAAQPARLRLANLSPPVRRRWACGPAMATRSRRCRLTTRPSVIRGV